ncbi:hypothetical protein [Neobacillus cucumis]|uniref:Uncharacterized protein n=1 Tax=Neobacillus cucumis TaxID=1740721 RepID=A0A2N5H6L8_9BACI|nr:hypothetical protein [Neobacillus cucumis]PLS01171.1 hypothetical protein CVD27_26680 [Neobacillus cucumis]
MKRQKTYFIMNNLIFEVQKPEITVRKIKIAQVKFENEEYKVLRKKFDETVFNIEKKPEGWFITEKDNPL